MRSSIVVHRFSSIAVLSIVQSAELGNNLPESNQYKEIEYTEQYSVCNYFLILSHRFCLSSRHDLRIKALRDMLSRDPGNNSFTIPLIHHSKYTLFPPCPISASTGNPQIQVVNNRIIQHIESIMRCLHFCRASFYRSIL